MNGAALLAIGTLVCLTIAVVYYANESRRHRLAAVELFRLNRDLREENLELRTDLAIWQDILPQQENWNNHPSQRKPHLRAIDGDA